MKLEVEIDDNIYKWYKKHYPPEFDVGQFMAYLITQQAIFTAKRQSDLGSTDPTELERDLTEDITILRNNLLKKFNFTYKE